MKIPAYWSNATAEDSDVEGKQVSFSCWRWSDTSQADAHESALAAATRVVQRMIHGEPLGRYGYGVSPLREEVIKNITNAQGEHLLVITQNAYGSLVLNTAQVMFMDLDFPPVKAGDQLRHFFSRFLGKQAPAPEAQQEIAAKSKLAGGLCRLMRRSANSSVSAR